MEGIIDEYKSRYLKAALKLEKTNKVLRKEFRNRFPVDSITCMTLNDYVSGTGSNDSFCYWLETKLRKDGSIKGGAPADKKFGIYYSKEKNKHVFLEKRWGIDLNNAFQGIKTEIDSLLLIGPKKDWAELSHIKLAPMFKNKILCTYYPDLFVNVFSPAHVEHFLSKLKISYDQNISVEEKRELLINYKINSPCMNEWSNFVFSDFLYKMFNPKNINNSVSEEQIEHCLNTEDANSCYIQVLKLTKQRKLNQKIVKHLKKLYDGQCQICGKNPVDNFSVDIVEGHHLEYFSINQNNNQNNILVVCPNCHSLIHKLNPIFDKARLEFLFSNDMKLPLKLNKHL